MRCLFVVSVIWLAVAASARAEMTQFSVTPTHLDSRSFTFSVATNAAEKSVEFHVTVTAKGFDLQSSSQVSLDIITTKTNSGGRMVSIEAAKPKKPLVMKKEKRVWTADFTVTRKALKNPDLYFVFAEGVSFTENGKTITMPDEDVYEIRLQDFVRPL